MNLAPIILFVYNRPQHTKRTLEALQQNIYATNSELIIYSDGSRTANTAQNVFEVRNYIRTVKGFKSVQIIEREQNLGLADSIIAGVTEVLSQYHIAIILEDDLITSPYFLKYMNEALAFYSNQEIVISVSGYTFPTLVNLPKTFFLKGADCLGWGTWERAWKLFNSDGKELLQTLRYRNLLHRFDIYGSGFYTKMLKDQIAGKNNSWAIRWYASALIQNKLTLYPGQSLIQHIGADSSGTNCGITDKLDTNLTMTPIEVNTIELREEEYILAAYKKFIYSLQPSLINRIVNLLYKRWTTK